jgi:hypothetical protein
VDYHEDLLFTDLALFNRKLADWLVVSDAERPHHSLGQQSPLSFLLQHQPECQRYWTQYKRLAKHNQWIENDMFRKQIKNAILNVING